MVLWKTKKSKKKLLKTSLKLQIKNKEEGWIGKMNVSYAETSKDFCNQFGCITTTELLAACVCYCTVICCNILTIVLSYKDVGPISD